MFQLKNVFNELNQFCFDAKQDGTHMWATSLRPLETKGTGLPWFPPFGSQCCDIMTPTLPAYVSCLEILEVFKTVQVWLSQL